jgi:hypothetical protein
VSKESQFEDLNPAKSGGDKGSEKVLSEVSDSDRLQTVRSTNEQAFNVGSKFSMSSLEAIGTKGGQFGIDGLGNENLKGDGEKPENAEDNSKWHNAKTYLDEVEKGGTLSQTDKDIATHFERLGGADKRAVMNELPNVTPESAQKYLLDHFDDLKGSNDKIALDALGGELTKGGVSAKDRANILWTMVNSEKIADVGFNWGSGDIAKNDVDGMVVKE